MAVKADGTARGVRLRVLLLWHSQEEGGETHGRNTLWPVDWAGAKPEKTARGKDEILGKAGVIMSELGKMLWLDGKKFRVTIECDPELGLFEMKRDDFS